MSGEGSMQFPRVLRAERRKPSRAFQRRGQMPWKQGSLCNWLTPPGELELKNGEVHLWIVDLDRNLGSLPALVQTLAPGERRKAAEFGSAVDRSRYILAHAALRSILTRYLRRPPAATAFSSGPRGKLELADGALGFSLSHSHDLALYAIGRGCDIGVDVKQVRPGVDEEMAGWLFPLRAIRVLEALPRPARHRVFFQGWTRMEACSKARGEGITEGLENFEAFLDRNNLLFLRARGDPWGSLWWLHDFLPRSGYVGALAAPNRRRRVRYWRWRADCAGAFGTPV